MNSKRRPEYYLLDTIFKEYQKNLLKDNPEILTSVYYPNFQKNIEKIFNEFKEKWKEDKIILCHKMSEQELTAKQIKEKLAEIKFEKLIEILENSIILDEKRKRYYINMMKAEYIYSKIQFEHKIKLKEIEDKIRTEIKTENPIKSRVFVWFENEFEIRRNNIIENLDQELQSRIEEELKEYPIQKSQIISYLIFLKYKKQNLELALKEKEKGCLKRFYLERKYLPPYDTKLNQDNQYILIRSEYLITDTNVSFWKLRLMFKRMQVIFKNVIVIGYNNFWNNSWGLKSFYEKQIFNDYKVDPITGVVTPYNQSYTYKSSINYLLTSISKSREKFLKASEKGFLGSKTGNVINLIENYIIKLIFLGILIIIFPIWIIFYSILSLFLTLLFLILSAFLIPSYQVFMIVILNLDDPDYNKNICFPLAFIILKRFFSQGFIHFILTIFAIIGQILLSILFILFSFIRWPIRSIYDCFTYIIIKCNGNIPKTDTSIAYRILGPGSMRTKFSKLDIEEALLLIRAQLEKYQLDEFSDKIKLEIDSPLKNFNDLNKRVFYNLGAYLVSHRDLDYLNIYTNKLNEQVTRRKSIYPFVSNNVRFSKEDLDLLLEATYDLIREFLQSNQLDNIWKKNELVTNNWRVLTEKILSQTFGTEEVLVNVDESELKPLLQKKEDQNSNFKLQIYNDLKFSSHVERARKKNAFSFKPSFSSKSDFLIDEDEFYHNKSNLNRINRSLVLEVENVEISPEVDIYLISREHLSLYYNDQTVVGNERIDADIEEDKILI